MSSFCKKGFLVNPFSFVAAASTMSCFLLLVQCAVRTGNLQATSRPANILNNSRQHLLETTQLYLGVAYSNYNEAVVTRAVNRTLATLSTELSTMNVALIPLYAALPTTFTAKVLAEVCATWENKSVVAVLVFASDSTGFMPVLAAISANIPVLWTTGEVKDGYLIREPMNSLEIRLDAGALDLFRALRALLLATHWHSFTLIYNGLPLRRDMADIMQELPLNPTFIPFRTNATPHAIFGLLSEVSRSTKGVILLMSTGETAKKVMVEAKKLNMVEGNFVWLWIDTTASVTARNDTKSNSFSSSEEYTRVKIERRIRETQQSMEEDNNFSSGFEDIDSDHSDQDDNFKRNINSKKSPNSRLGDYLDNIRFQNELSFFENSRNINGVRIIKNNKPNVNNQILDDLHTNPDSDIYRDKKQIFPSIPLENQQSKLNESKINKTTALYIATSENKGNTRVKSNSILKLLSNKNDNSLDYFHFNWFANIRNHSRTDSEAGSLFNFSNRLVRRRNKRDTVFNLRKSVFESENKRKFDDTQNTLNLLPVNKNNLKLVNNLQNSTLVRDFYDLSNSNNLVIRNSDSKLSKRFLVERSAKARQRVDFRMRENLKPNVVTTNVPLLPVGMLAIRALPLKFDRHLVRSSVKRVVESMKRAVIKRCKTREEKIPISVTPTSCWHTNSEWQKSFTKYFLSELKAETEIANMSDRGERALAAKFQILNLVPESTIPLVQDIGEVQESTSWRAVGDIVGQTVHLDTVVWPGGDLVPVSTSRGVRSVFRVVTALNPPFVMEGELDEDGQCLRGLECHRLLTSDKDNLTLVFNEMNRLEEVEEEIDARSTQERLKEEYARHIWGQEADNELQSRYKYRTNCCYGLSMDLLENIAQELEFDFHLYIVSDEMYGSKVLAPTGETKWNGIVGDLVSGAAHMSFAALSVSSPRSQVIDFSVPYFFSGVSFLAAPKQRTDIPLLAFLLPFSPELWIAIFTSLNVTAVAVAIYEWLSPFGLNPWGRQRSKNFSMSSALWVCWGLLCGHLVAFKAPKSWPNKFLINVWGGFSVIFVASYTANIAALIAGLFFHNAVGDYHDRSLLSQRVGTPRASAADYYVHRANQLLWEHMQRYSVKDVATGVQHLKNGSLDILIADTPILDYYRATDHGCKLQKIGDAINEDTYAVGMTKGFPLKDSISAVIAKYSSNGYMDILQEKWYGGLPCFKLATDMAQPRPLGVAAVTGVFLLLGMGMIVGCLILLIEHLFYKYTLPILRHKPKGTIWKSRNIMFFSQKLYRFINCVELVSPHHAARELVHTLRQGQITSLFQKSVKRKEHEQRRRRKSKAQFFEMIQEIRRVQQEERVGSVSPPKISLPCGDKGKASPRPKKHSDQPRRHSRLDLARRLSKDVFRSKSSSNLSIRRLSSDINIAAGRFLDCHGSQAIGRRLSRDTNLSPPDINSRRASHLSVYRKTSNQFLSPGSDLDSGSDISVPKSPIPLSIPTLNPKSPDCTNTSRFSYVDIKSPSFKNKLSRFKDNTLSDCNPKVIIHHDDEDSKKSITRDTWPNTSDSTTEHLIEIIIPSEEKRKPNINKDFSKIDEPLKTSKSLTGLSLLEHISTLSENHGQPIPNPTKPKIVSYLPKKHPRNMSADTPHKRITGKKDRRRSSSDLVLRVETEKREPKRQENCQIVSQDCIRSEQSTTSNKSDNDAFNRLSKDELLSLLQIPERELKQRLLQAIQDRDPT